MKVSSTYLKHRLGSLSAVTSAVCSKVSATSQSGYLLDKEGNDAFSEFPFKVIVGNCCSQEPLSLCRDLYSHSTELSLSFFCCCFLHYQPRFAGLRMVTVPWSVWSHQLLTSFNVPPPVATSVNQTCLVHVGCDSCISGIMPTAYILIAWGLPACFLHPRPRSLHRHRNLMFSHRYSGV